MGGIIKLAIERPVAVMALILITIIFGAVAVARSRVETIEEIAARLEAALNHIDRERLVVAPDCGLGLLPPAIAAEKLTLMVKATRLV